MAALHLLTHRIEDVLLFMLTGIQIPAFFFASTKWNLYLASTLKLGSDLMNALDFICVI
jgi:hypothetical protein